MIPGPVFMEWATEALICQDATRSRRGGRRGRGSSRRETQSGHKWYIAIPFCIALDLETQTGTEAAS
jgi:hypothetical protein